MNAEDQAKALLERFRDPVVFAREVLGVDPWSRQAELMRLVAASDKVAVRSGHKVSKSTSAACLALWFVCCFPDARVVLTAPTSRQVNEILWFEIKKRYRKARVDLGGVLNETPGGGLRFRDGRACFGFSTDEPERMSGISGKNLLFLVDEASGIDAQIFEAIEGNRAGGARVALFSNPTQTSGVFYDAFHEKREYWDTIHISSWEAAEAGISGLATREWCQEHLEDWGADSPLYDVRVNGNFPSQSENAIIGLSLVEAALGRWDKTKAEGRLELGVDPARFGDDESVVICRRGFKAMPAHAFRGLDGVQLAGKVLELIRNTRIGDERPLVKVDVIGIGASVADQLGQYKKELELVQVNVSEAARDSEQYSNLRTESLFALAAWLRAGGAIPNDARMVSEMLAPTYGFDLRGRQKAEPKDDIKKRLGRSPDRADALALSVHALRTHSVVKAPPPLLSNFEDSTLGVG